MKTKKTEKIIKVVYPKIGGIYQHYKGGTYKVITLASHSETGEDMVVYQNLERLSVHVRPLSMWFDVISKKTRNKKRIVRFELIS